MNTAIIYHSYHHHNTKKLLDALKGVDPSLTLIDATKKEEIDLSHYERIGIASGIYFGGYSKQVIEYADKYLPSNKEVFYIYTHGAPIGGFLTSIRKVTKKKRSKEIGKFHTRGYDTYVFKRFGGIAKNRPNSKDISKVIKFYLSL